MSVQYLSILLLITIISSAASVSARRCNKTDTFSRARVAGGFVAEAGQFPSYVNLLIKGVDPGPSMTCGGVLIDDQRILTAAHCVTGNQVVMEYIIVLGFDGQEVGRSTKACASPRFHRSLFNLFAPVYDVGLVKLDEPITFNSDLQPARLPTRRIRHGDKAYATGRGMTESGELSDRLLALSMERVSCPFLWWHPTITCMMSTNERGRVCHGDSGGPLLAENGRTVVALASFVPNRPCEEHGDTNGFADVYSLQDEIDRLKRECN